MRSARPHAAMTRVGSTPLLSSRTAQSCRGRLPLRSSRLPAIAPSSVIALGRRLVVAAIGDRPGVGVQAPNVSSQMCPLQLEDTREASDLCVPRLQSALSLEPRRPTLRPASGERPAEGQFTRRQRAVHWSCTIALFRGSTHPPDGRVAWYWRQDF